MVKKISIVLFADESARPVRFRLGVRWLWLSGVALLLGSTTLGYLGYDYCVRVWDRQESVRLRTENNHLQQKLDRYSLELSSLREDLHELALTDARLRQLADSGSDQAELPVAVGGLPELDSSVTDDSIELQISRLQVALEVRRQSHEEVRNFLNDKVSLSRATPRGWPTRGWLTSYFGKRVSPFSGRKVMHEGLDIAANTGTSVYATADGVVARVSYSPSYGKTVVIDHGYGYRTIFGHTSKILVKSGQRIHRGDRVALVGNTGRSTGPHLHYELRLDGVPIDPRKTL